MRLSLILALKSNNNFAVFKSLSVCLFKTQGPREDITNLVNTKKYLALSNCITVCCRVIVFYNFEFILALNQFLLKTLYLVFGKY